MTDPVFFAPSRRYFGGSEIAELTGAEARRPEPWQMSIVTGSLRRREGGEGMLVFVEGKRNAALLDGLEPRPPSFARPILPTRCRPAIAVLVTPRPQWAFAMIGRLLYPAAASPAAADRRNRHFACALMSIRQRSLEPGSSSRPAP